MRCILEHINILRNIIVPKTTPSFRYESPHARFLDSFEDHLRKLVGIVDHNRAESNIHGRFPCMKKS